MFLRDPLFVAPAPPLLPLLVITGPRKRMRGECAAPSGVGNPDVNLRPDKARHPTNTARAVGRPSHEPNIKDMEGGPEDTQPSFGNGTSLVEIQARVSTVDVGRTLVYVDAGLAPKTY